MTEILSFPCQVNTDASTALAGAGEKGTHGDIQDYAPPRLQAAGAYEETLNEGANHPGMVGETHC